MDNNQINKLPTLLPELFFIFIVLIDLTYVLVVSSQPDIIINAWFVIFPIVSPFYFVFSCVALVGIYRRKKMGLMWANIIILLGALFASVSYLYIYQNHYIIQLLFIPLIVMNFIAMSYMAYISIRNKFE